MLFSSLWGLETHRNEANVFSPRSSWAYLTLLFRPLPNVGGPNPKGQKRPPWKMEYNAGGEREGGRSWKEGRRETERCKAMSKTL